VLHFTDDDTDPNDEVVALEAMESDDPSDWYFFVDTGPWLPVVAKNRVALQERGTFERALLRAWYALTGYDSGTNWEWDPAWIEELFLVHADRDRLLKEGDPLPAGREFRVFRGVAGRGKKRREQGLSWSLDRSIAVRFANAGRELGLANPVVLEGIARREDVLAFLTWRNEAEIIAKDVRIVAKYASRGTTSSGP
jgi:hypothetical protein